VGAGWVRLTVASAAGSMPLTDAGTDSVTLVTFTLAGPWLVTVTVTVWAIPG
jgi:hypothetical protein